MRAEPKTESGDMEDMIVIEAAGDLDEARLATLWRECGLVAEYNDPAEDIDFARAKENSDILVARSNSEIIASVLTGHDGHRGWLYYVAVAPSARKRGLGALIVKAGEDWLRERGVRKVMLLVRETNLDVQAFYERIGYETVPRVVMQKWL
jgi:ribosomal protein S18 acetylase RimI-like enzyme